MIDNINEAWISISVLFMTTFRVMVRVRVRVRVSDLIDDVDRVF